jgi:hypothetical protein
MVADDALLDYESDEGSTTKHSVIPREAVPAAMDTECVAPADATAGPSSSRNSTVPDAMFYQCRASRLSSFRDTLVSISSDTTFGKKISSPSVPIGTFEDHTGLKNTFHGSRLLRGNATVNQSISLSFDPANLTCLSCTDEHIVTGTKPVTMCFADQNFVASIPFTNGNCINVIRVENSSLNELLEIAQELFGNIKIPEGSVFLFGSASYLGRCGTSLYASEWSSLVTRASVTWRGVHVCPLVPIILSECPGSITREICELSVWFNNIYDNSNHGLNATWSALVEAMEAISTGSIRLETMDTYKVALPSSLNCAVLNSAITFCTHNSRPVAFPGLPKDNCDELLSILLTNIFNNFRACQSPENLLVRATTANTDPHAETGLQKVVIAGASNLKYSVAYFSDPELEFIDLSSPGWVPTPGNIQDLKEKILAHKARKTSAFVFDLFGNSSVRFEQFDGSTALPFKSHGKHHLGGDVLVTPPDVFKKTVENVMPILIAKGDIPCVLIPPIPRYLFSRCCDDKGHCTNANKENYQADLLSGFLQLRNFFFYNLFTKRTGKQYRYEIPREEPREAHGYLALDFMAMVALSVYVTLREV